MTDPNPRKTEQHRILTALHDLWIADPELRLCQLLSNLAFREGWSSLDLYHWPDEFLYAALKMELNK